MKVMMWGILICMLLISWVFSWCYKKITKLEGEIFLLREGNKLVFARVEKLLQEAKEQLKKTKDNEQ